MTIELYVNTSEPTVVDKVIVLAETLSGFLRDNSSVTTPIIRAEHANPSACNYAYISEFDRYYYVDDMISMRTNLWELHLRVDVLMSFKTDIRNSQAIVEETATESAGGNMYLNNDAFVAQVKHKTDIIQFPSGFGSIPYYVLITAGGVTT